MSIKTWRENKEASDIRMNREDWMQDEIAELRSEIERLKLSVEETASGPLSEEAYDIAQSKIKAQHKVLEQALNALQYHMQQTRPIHNTELVIEAIQEVLK